MLIVDVLEGGAAIPPAYRQNPLQRGLFQDRAAG
jgi:hypothetical protein